MPLFSDDPGFGKKPRQGIPTSNRRGLFSDDPGFEYVTPVVNARTAREPAPAKPQERSPFRAGLESAYTGLRYGLPYALEKKFGEVTPQEEAEYQTAIRESAARQERLLPGGAPSFSDVTSGRAGLGRTIYENLALSTPQMVATLGGSAAGALAGGSVAGPAGAGVGFFAGGTAVGAPMFAGSNVERATEGGRKALTEEQAGRSLGVAPAQALADTLVGKFLPGVGKMLPGKLGAAATGNLLSRVGKSAAGASATEFLTEGAQQLGERYAAGLDLTSRDALKEYFEAGATAALVAGPLGGLGGIRKAPTQPQGEDTDLADAGQETPPPPTTMPGMEAAAAGASTEETPTIKSKPLLPSDEVKSVFSKENVFGSLHAGMEGEPTDFSQSLARSLNRAFKTGNLKSAENLAGRLDKYLDEDIHGPDEVQARIPYVERARSIVSNYTELMSEALGRDEELTNPALIAERAAANNAAEIERIQAMRDQEQADLVAENARVEAERQAALDAAAKKVEAIHRKGILEQVAKDPNTRDPVARFTALLKRNGFSPELTSQEQVALTEASVNAEARLAGEAAKMDMTVAEYKQKLAEDDARQRTAESGTASMEARIREAGTRQPTAPRAPTPPQGKTNRAAPDNFQLEMQSELTDADIEAQQKAIARRQAREDRALAKANARAEKRAAQAQGEMFTPTGKVRKAVEAKAAVPAPTVSQQIKEKVSAAKEGQKPKGRVAERQRVDEKRKAPEAGRGNRPEPSTQVEEKVTHQQVADRANDAKQNGYINETTRQRIALLAEQKNVPAERLNQMLDQAVEKGSMEPSGKAAVAKGQKTKTSTRAERGQLADALKRELQRLGLNKVGLGVVNDLANIFEEGEVAGRYMPGWAMIDIVFADMKRAMETLHHEVIHYLRDADIINENEWKTLSAVAGADKKLMAHIDKNWPTLNPEEKMEEAIAEMFRVWMRTQKAQQPGVRGVFQKLKNFITALRRGFNKPEFAPVKAIFMEINQGKRGDANVTTLRGDPSGKVKLSVEKRFKDLPPSVRNSILYVSDTFSNHSGRFLTALGFTENLIEDAQKLIPAVKDYLDLMRKKMAAKEKIEVGINDLRERFQRLGLKRQGAEAGTINSFLQQTVDAQKWGFKPDWLKEGEYELDSDVEAAFKRLPKEEQQIVKDTLRTTYDMLKLRIDTAVASVNSLYDGMIEQAIENDDSKLMDKLDKEKRNALAQYQGLFRARQNVPYVSKRRNGDYIVVAKSAELIAAQEANDQKLIDKLVSQEEHYFVDMYDSMAEAKAKQREMAEKGRYSGGSIRASETDKATEQFVGSRDMMVAYERLRSQIQQLATSPDGKSGPSKKVIKDMERLAIDLYLTSLENSSARKSEMKKKNVSSDQLDMMRNFVSQGVAEANLIASMMYSGKVEQALREMRAQAFSDRQADPEKAARYYNEIALRHASSLGDAPNNFAELVKSVTSTMMLAFSPSYYMTNLTQPWVLSVPYMAGEHNYDKVVAEMLKSYEEVNKAWKDVPLLSALNLENLSPDVRKELEVLSERGQIDIGMNKELGQFTSLNKNVVENSFNKVGNVIRATSQKVESINRVSTAAAAVRLAKEKGLTSEQAIEYAGKVIRLTHGPYDSFNAPRWMRGPFLSTITQFKKFQLMQLTLIGKLVSGSVSQADTADAKLERAIMRRQLAYTLGHTAVLTGVKGTFGYAAITFMINTILNAIADEDDEPADIEKLMYEKLGDVADVIMSGAPALAGLDISDRIGMGQALSVIPYVEPELSRQGYEKALVGIMGPGVAAFGKLVDGLGTIYSGDYLRGLELMLPNGLDDGIKAFRESTEGVKTRKGDVLLKPEEMSFGESFATAMGLRTTKVSERYRKQDDVKKIDQFYKDKTGELKREYLEAKDAGDEAKEDQVRARWRNIQDAREAAGLNRQPMSTLLKARAERKRQEEMTAGGVQYRAKDRRFQLAEEDEE